MKYLFLLLMTISLNCFSTSYWVKKTGSDSNTCIGEAQACLTINKALSLAILPNDTVDIVEGRYKENSETSPWVGNCGLLDGNVSSICVNGNGTLGNPIIIRAAAGSERKVIIDSEGVRSGISLRKMDYIHIKNLVFENNYVGGITNPGGPALTTGAPDEINLSIGCLIEGNVIDGVETEDGVNASGIYFWSTKDWVIRNNYVDTHHKLDFYVKTAPNGMQTYGAINAIIENNTVVNNNKPIMFKDHYVASRDPTVHVQEATIRYNLLLGRTDGINYGLRGTNYNPTGNNEIYGNIISIRNANSSLISTSQGAHSINGAFNIHNNIFVSATRSGANALNFPSSSSLSVNNNIFMGVSDAIRCSKGTFNCNLISADYNIYDPLSRFVVDNNSPAERYYNSLALWKLALSSQSESLLFDNPDANSVTGDFNAFTRSSIRMYKNFPNTIGAQKVGIYVLGTESVGANFTYRATPSAPN